MSVVDEVEDRARSVAWRSDELSAVDASQELEIATVRDDGSRRSWTPIWVVATGGEVFVRTWHRRTTGWYGDAVAGRTAYIRVPGLETEVQVDDIGLGERAGIDAAYVAKYGAGQRTDDGTASSTLRLRKRSAASSSEQP